MYSQFDGIVLYIHTDKGFKTGATGIADDGMIFCRIFSTFTMNKLTRFKVRISKAWKVLGPGMITGASDDDPSGIATYSQAGAAFGLSTLWTALLTFPLMASIQEMCARIGVVTSKGLSGVLREHYPKKLMYTMMVF